MSIRGHQSLYVKLFPPQLGTDANQKGRRNVNLDKRDRALACRYYYHVAILRKRFDDALLDLVDEFFITPTVIGQRISTQVKFIAELRDNKVSAAALKKEYPHFSWIIAPAPVPAAPLVALPLQ